MDRSVTVLRFVLIAAVIVAVVVGIAGCASGDAGTTEPSGGTGTETPATDTPAEEDPAVTLVETKCSMCHSTDRVWSATQTREEWVTTIDRMRANGAVLTDDEYDQIVEYLANQ